MKFRFTLFFITALHISSFAQTQQIIDSVAIRMNQIESLQKAGQTEQALLELEDLRWFVRREKAYIPTKHIMTGLSVYNATLDQASANKFLEEMRVGLPTIQNLNTRAEQTKELIRIYEVRSATDKALALQKQLATDAIQLQNQLMEQRMDSVRRNADSLVTIHQMKATEQTQFFQVKKERAWLLFGMGALAFLTMLGAGLYQRRKLETDLLERDNELDHLRGYLTSQDNKDVFVPQPAQPIRVAPVTPEPPVQIHEATPGLAEESPLPAKTNGSSYIPSIAGAGNPQMYKPIYLALLVEPNRQIAMYLKSLLGPEFEVEMASTMAEASTIAKSRIPDLVICDTILGNSGSGIDFARHIKQDVKTNHVPVVLVSSASGTSAEQELVRASADLVIPRPMLDDDLDAQIKQLFKVRSTGHQEFTQILQLWFTKSKQDPADPFLRNLVYNIERYIPDASFSPADLARTMQYEKVVFNRKVQALTGRETHDIIKVLRLEKAKYLLENRVAPVQVIAGLVGFDNQGAFSRAFKEHFGDTNILLLNA
jgi:CheY-like chemotaxis protein